MATNRANDNPAGSRSNAEVSDITKKDEAPITLMLKWSKQPRKPRTSLEKSLQSWFSKRQRNLNCSVIRIRENKNALIKIEPFPGLDIVQKLSGEILTLQDGSTVTVESVAQGNSKPQTADDVSNTSTASTYDDKTEKDDAPITLVLKWSKQSKQQEQNLEKSLQNWFNKREKSLNCSVIRILKDKNALIKIKPLPDLDIVLKLSGEILTLKDNTTVTVESVILGSPKLTQTADDASTTSTASTSDDKRRVSDQSDQVSIPEKTANDDKKKSEDGVGLDKQNVSGQKRSQNDLNSASEISPENQIRQNQEDSVSLPVNFFWYLSRLYKDEIKSIEEETGCKMDATVNVTFKGGSQDKALSEFTNLVQKCFNESRESVVPVQDVSPERCSDAFKLIQKEEKKALLTLTPKEITVCGPDSDQLKRVLERNEKPDLVHDDTPMKIKMTIKDPLSDAGIQMEESSWRKLNVGHDVKIRKIKEKFDVDFREFRMDGDKVQLKASYNGPEGNPSMESHAVRALLRLYQKSVTSCLNYKNLQGASGFRDRSKMHEDESEKRSTTEGGATGGDSTEENCPICFSPFTEKSELQT